MQKGRTIIVGAGGFGRELISWARDCHQAGSLPAVAGVLDDDATALDGFNYELDFLGSVADFSPLPNDSLLMAVGSPPTKERVATILKGRGGRFATLIHPTAVIAASARIGEGVIFCPLSLASADAEIGQLVSINALSSVGHDVRIGEYTTISAHVDLTGGVSIGRAVMIGTGAKLLPRVKVGNGATIGAGSTVYRTVPAGRSVFAPPAKLLRVA